MNSFFVAQLLYNVAKRCAEAFQNEEGIFHDFFPHVMDGLDDAFKHHDSHPGEKIEIEDMFRAIRSLLEKK